MSLFPSGSKAFKKWALVGLVMIASVIGTIFIVKAASNSPSSSQPLPVSPSPSQPLPVSPSPSRPLPVSPSPSQPLPGHPVGGVSSNSSPASNGDSLSLRRVPSENAEASLPVDPVSQTADFDWECSYCHCVNNSPNDSPCILCGETPSLDY